MHTPLSALCGISPAAPLFDYLPLHEAAKLISTCRRYNVLLQGNLSLKFRLELARAEFEPLILATQKIHMLLVLSYQIALQEKSKDFLDLCEESPYVYEFCSNWEDSDDSKHDLALYSISTTYALGNDADNAQLIASQIKTPIRREEAFATNMALLAKNNHLATLAKNTMYAGANFSAALKIIKALAESLIITSDPSDSKSTLKKAHEIIDLKVKLRKYRCGFTESE